MFSVGVSNIMWRNAIRDDSKKEYYLYESVPDNEVRRWACDATVMRTNGISCTVCR